MDPKLLITGAHGFLAQAVAKEIPRDWELMALVRSGTGRLPAPYRCTYEKADQLVADEARLDVILHLAARIPTARDAAPRDLIAVNVDLVSRLVQAYPDARHVLASSVSVFGVPESLPLTIDSRPHLPNAYGLSKLAAERLVRQARSHAVIRFSSLIGVGMKPGSFIPSAVAGARAGGITLVGDGQRLQNYLDIDDAAAMCVRAATKGESFLALGIGERSYKNEEVAGILAGFTGASIIRESADRDYPSFVYDLRGSTDLGPVCRTLDDTLRQMLQA